MSIIELGPEVDVPTLGVGDCAFVLRHDGEVEIYVRGEEEMDSGMAGENSMLCAVVLRDPEVRAFAMTKLEKNYAELGDSAEAG